MKKTAKKIVVYGAFWCPDTHRSARLLRKLGIPYEARGIENPKVDLALKSLTHKDKNAIPAIFFPDGTQLSEPSNKELREKIKLLKSQGLLK